eukprot:GDKJ01025299.1.p1 GENE.GDKJ01025299.1~~GDKJ01025299.1.p1  ORF type:complete len:307 (-),score=43.91 GDKJ01025299.1:17-937(-)
MFRTVLSLNKQLSEVCRSMKLCSVQEAKTLISLGHILVDGKQVSEDVSVFPSSSVTLSKRGENILENQLTLILNKPSGYFSKQDKDGAKTLFARKLLIEHNRSPACFQKVNPQRTNNLIICDTIPHQCSGALFYSQDTLFRECFFSSSSTLHAIYEVVLDRSTPISPELLSLVRNSFHNEGTILSIFKSSEGNEDTMIITIPIAVAHSLLLSSIMFPLSTTRVIRRGIVPLKKEVLFEREYCDEITNIGRISDEDEMISNTQILKILGNSGALIHEGIWMSSNLKTGGWTVVNRQAIKKLCKAALI